MDGCVELLMDSESSGYDSSTVAMDGYRFSLSRYPDRRSYTTPFSVSLFSM